ncbi:hypothetical protein [Microvirga solisilvae]|uniref:hypothetical protein n=1 Tax=Microvirga solisilvae TaxID=2919498 RepID=UPI001FAEF976|nr:hypothetical protein [Microvirga solisilvae]
MSKKSKNFRVFIGFSNTASYFSSLAEGFDKLGHRVEYIDLEHDHPYLRKFQSQKPSLPVRWFERAHRKHKLSPSFWTRQLLACSKFLCFVFSLLRCDVYIFSIGETFYGLNDLLILRALRKKTIFTFLGSASRPIFINGVYTNTGKELSLNKAVQHSHDKRLQLEKIARHCTAIVENPPAGQMQSRPFYNHSIIGFPVSLSQRAAGTEAQKELDPLDQPRPVRIIHAPSNRSVKGSDFIEQIIAELKAEGFSIDFSSMTKMSNSEVLQALSECDFVIDQAYSDGPLAGLATEAATLGKPAVVGGYAQEETLRFLGDTDLPMSLYVKPEHMKDRVRDLLLSPALRQDLGREVKNYVTREWAPEVVAERYVRIARGTAPQAWLVDPRQLNYWLGCGAPKTLTIDYLRKLVRKRSKRVLGVLQSKQLRAQILEVVRARDEVPASTSSGEPLGMEKNPQKLPE